MKPFTGITQCILAPIKRIVPHYIKEKIKAWIFPGEPSSPLSENESQAPKVYPGQNQSDASLDSAPVTGETRETENPDALPYFLEEKRLAWEDYQQKWHDHFGERQEDYFAMHKRRYYELLNTFKYYYPLLRSNPLVLDIGISEFLPFYTYFFPGIRLVTVDRPLESSGFSAEYCIAKGGSERHYHIDLNQMNLSSEYGSPPLGQFDYIICTEVIEHLMVNPVEFLGSLIKLLFNGGFLYLTTPNFFRLENLDKINHRINPQAVYPKRGENSDAHHHYREYEMEELVRFVGEAGGTVEARYFSGCWDEGSLLDGILKEHPERKSNLVLLVKRSQD